MANIEAVKLVDKSFIVLSSDNNILSYTIKLKNTGTTDATNVILQDIFPDGVCPINNSIYINGKSICDTNIKCGIDLGTLPVGEEWTITFSVRISLKISLNVIDNLATILYTDENGLNSITTNKVTTHIIIIDLCINKSVDTCFALVGDILNYTVEIKNKGNTAINDVVLRDIHSDGVELVNEAQTLNDWIIGTINPNQTIIITFKMKVTKIPCPANIKNKVCLKFTYTIPETTPPIISPGVAESGVVTVEIGPKSIKTFNVEGYNTLSGCKPEIGEIIDKNADIEIINVKKINTIKNVSCQGQILTGCKVIVNGKINLNIQYIDQCTKKVYSASFVIPFMSYIVIPDCCSSISINDITGTIYDIYIDKVNGYTVYHNMLVELEYTTDCCIE